MISSGIDTLVAAKPMKNGGFTYRFSMTLLFIGFAPSSFAQVTVEYASADSADGSGLNEQLRFNLRFFPEKFDTGHYRW